MKINLLKEYREKANEHYALILKKGKWRIQNCYCENKKTCYDIFVYPYNQKSEAEKKIKELRREYIIQQLHCDFFNLINGKWKKK